MACEVFVPSNWTHAQIAERSRAVRDQKSSWISVFILVLSICASQRVFAQAQTTSTLTGTVTDSTGAVVPGATVSITSPSLIGGAHSAITDSQGAYRFPSLQPGVYALTAELQGFRSVTHDNIRLPLGATITMDVAMAQVAAAETVVVSGRPSMVDVKSSAANTQIDNELLQNLPTSRFQPDVIDLAPGITNSVAYGGTASSNALLIDGVDVSDPDGGSPWSFFNYNWIQEVQVVGLGANAEYGEFTGAAANSIVRSGANRFSGLFEYLTERNGWISDNTGSLSEDLRADFKPREIKTWYDTSAQVGGPIMKDKLWFFTGVQYFKNIDRPAGFVGAYTSEKDPRYIGKVNWAASPNVKVEGFYEWDKYDITGRGAGPDRPPETTVIEPAPETNWNARVTWTINSKTLLDVRNGGYTGYYPLEPTPPNTRTGPFPRRDENFNYSVNSSYYYRADRTRNVTAATLTRYADKFAGKSHEFKFGFEFERSKIVNEYGYPGGRLYYDYGGAPYLAYLWDGYVVNATGKRGSLYAQDTWTVNDRLTINPGIRFNFNRGSVPDRGTVLSTNPISPRIGAAWDVTGDHRTVVRLHYGRYHDALLGGTYYHMDTSQQHPKYTALVLGENDFEIIDTVDVANNVGMDPDIKPSYVDQYLAGIERELFPDFSVQVQYIRRNYENFMGFIDTGATYDPVQRRDPGPDNELDTADDGELITVFNKSGDTFYLMTNPDNASRTYNGFQVNVRKRFSHNWQTSTSYTWSRTRGNVNNNFGANAAGSNSTSDTGQGGVFANPNRAILSDGPAVFDYTHHFKAEGTYRIPYWGGFNISGIYRYITGAAWGRRAGIRDLDQGSETVRIEPRGTRRVDALNNFDFRVEKTFVFGQQSRTAGVFLDIFNLNNQGIADSTSERPIIDTSGDTFGNPRRWIDPRLLRLGVRFTF
jgi:Carboxypeptidase regulatory-like domain/TonB dependent receptor-like, beta-barrel